MKLKVGVLGPGAMGCLFAGRLAAGNRVEVGLLARGGQAHELDVCIAEQFRENGAERLKPVQVPIVPSDAHGRLDVLLVTTKAFDAMPALDSVRHRLNGESMVIFLCNGVLALYSHLSLSDNWLGGHLVLATTTHGAYLTRCVSGGGTVEVIHAGLGSTILGLPRLLSPSPQAAVRLEELAQAMSLAPGLESTTVDPDVERQLWLKLAANCIINPLTAIHNCPNGQVFELPEVRELAQEVCQEIHLVAEAMPGASDCPTPNELVEYAQETALKTAQNHSSMLMDVVAGRPTEIEVLNAWVARQAVLCGGSAPCNAMLAQQVAELEH